MQQATPLRVITGKIGLDGHDRGIKVVSRALRDSGLEVIYLGMRLAIAQVADAAVDEDADVLALNFSGADHLELLPQLLAALRERGRSPDELTIIIGGIIPDEDIPLLKGMGVAEVFLPGTPLAQIVAYLKGPAAERKTP